MEVSGAQTQFQEDDTLIRKQFAREKEQHLERLTSLEDEHKKEVKDVTHYFEKEHEELEKAYQINISREAELQEKKMRDLRNQNAKELSQEKKQFENEFEALRTREKKRLETYRKNQDSVMEKLHDKYLAAQGEMERSGEDV